jgi:hypothetical protein
MASVKGLECKVVALANVVVLCGPGSVDGIDVVPGDVVLLVGQEHAAENGLWTVGRPWTRHPAASSAEDILGLSVVVRQGARRGDTMWQCMNAPPVELGSTELLFAEVLEMEGRGASARVRPPLRVIEGLG